MRFRSYYEEYKKSQDLKSRLREFQQKTAKDWDKSQIRDLDKTDRFVEELCHIYLQITAKDRRTIRKQFGGLNKLWNLLSYASRASGRIKSPSDAESLLLGLAAISIEDSTFDFRDSLLCLGQLYLSSEQAGIDPKLYFTRVAEVSNSQAKRGESSTADLIRNFHRTAYFREIKRKSGSLPDTEPTSPSDARPYARMLISTIKQYNEHKVEIGRKEKDIYTHLKIDIDQARRMYEENVGLAFGEGPDYFYEELVSILADGDATKIGPDYPKS